MDRLGSLLDANIVCANEEPGGELRFTLLETIREFAQEQLELSGELQQVQRRHARLFLDLSEAAATRLFGEEQAEWFARLELEHGNLRAALQRCLDQGDVEAAGRLAAALSWFWLIRGHLGEGGRRLQRVVDTPGTLSAPARAGVLLGLAMMVWAQADYARGRALAAESADTFREVRDPRGVATGLNYVARAALEQGDYARSRGALAEAIGLYREQADRWGVYFSHAALARVEWAEGSSSAHDMLLEHLENVRRQGDRRGMGFSNAYLSGIALDRGDPLAAQAFAEESLARFEEIGDRRGTGYALMFLAGAVRERGDLPAAREHYGRCLRLLRDFGPRLEIVWALEGCAVMHVQGGQALRGLRLWAAAVAIRDDVGAPLPPAWRGWMEDRLRPAWNQLGPPGAMAALADGGHLSPTEAIAEAIDEL